MGEGGKTGMETASLGKQGALKRCQIFRFMVILGLLSVCQSITGEEIPEWWVTRGIVNTQLPPNNFAVANLGQLKHVAYQTWIEMTNQLAQVVTNETDPTVPANIKDGVDWSELSGIPLSVSNPLNTALTFDSTSNLLELTDSGGTLRADLSGLTLTNVVENISGLIGIGTTNPLWLEFISMRRTRA